MKPSYPKIKAMVFAAGLGTRFKPWTDHHPKALAIVNGKSLLQRNVEYLLSYDIQDVIVNVHHFPEQIIAAIDHSKGWGANISISDEADEVLETGGGLLKARPFFNDCDILITINADILTSLDLSRLIRFHLEHAALISLAVMQRNSSRHLLFNHDMRLSGWKNTITGEERISIPDADMLPFAFSGISTMGTQVFNKIRQRGNFSLLDVFLELTKNEKVLGYDHTGDQLTDVGKPGSVEDAEKYFR